MKREINKYLVILTFLAVMTWFWGVNEPFVGAYGANLNYFTLASKNFLRFGYSKLHFLPTYYAGGNINEIPPFYLHHPVFYYTLVSLSFILFGFQNWAAAVTPVIFSLLTVFWLYKIASLEFSKRIGYWSAFFGSIFPMMTVFGRQTIFEPAILSLLLGCYYYFLTYLKFKKRISLIKFTIFSFIAVVVDWGGLYFIFPFILLYKRLPKRKEKFKAILTYLLVCFIGISLFLLIVLRFQGNFNDLISAFNVRKESAELFSLPLPYLRLIGVTILRMIVYFTPLSIFLLPNFLKNIRKSYTVLFFFIFGLINIVILPTATFGHIYFLFYFIPFFSFLFALYFDKLIKKIFSLSTLLIFLICIFSFLVTFMKWQQVKKQSWRYTAASQINKRLLPYETLAVMGFPGDVFEQYFFHPTIAFNSYEELLSWLNSEKKRYAVFSCWGNCTIDDLEFINNIPYKKQKFDNSWLIINSEVADSEYSEFMVETQNKAEKESILLQWYRNIRNIFSVGQL